MRLKKLTMREKEEVASARAFCLTSKSLRNNYTWRASEFFCVCVTLNLFCVRHAWLCVSASRGIAFQSIARAAISWYYIQNSRDCSSSNNVNAKTDWKYNQNWRLQRSAARVGGLKFFDDFRIIHCAPCVWHLFKQHPSRLAPGCFLSINYKLNISAVRPKGKSQCLSHVRFSLQYINLEFIIIV
jgi:hypothetical protein